MSRWIKISPRNIVFGMVVIIVALIIIGNLFIHIPAILTTFLACSIGALILGFFCGKKFSMNHDNEYVMIDDQQQDEINQINQEVMAFNKKNILPTKIPLDSNHSETSPSWSRFYADTANYFNRFFYSTSKRPKSNTRMDKLFEAISKCEDETNAQNLEVNVITNALNQFNHEARNLTAKAKKTQFIIPQGNLEEITEQNCAPSSLSFRSKEECSKLLEELGALITNYPKNEFENNPCIETVELYLEARRKHHADILCISDVLLPNLLTLLNETRLNQKTQSYPNLK